MLAHGQEVYGVYKNRYKNLNVMRLFIANDHDHEKLQAISVVDPSERIFVGFVSVYISLECSRAAKSIQQII